jgi:hypothetical protein
MTRTTETLRDKGFRTLDCDIPAELTIRQYRQTRAEGGGRLSRLPRLLLRRGRRRAAGA